MDECMDGWMDEVVCDREGGRGGGLVIGEKIYRV